MEDFQTLIGPDEVLEIYSQRDTVLFDCRFYLDDVSRGRKEFILSHIPGAVYLDTNHDLSSPVIGGVTGRHPLPHPGILESTLRAAGLENDHQVIVYDQLNGAYASRAWWLLRWLGHEKVAVLNGGFKAWKEMNGPVDNQWPLPGQGSFKGNLRHHWVVDKDEIPLLKTPLVDSREYKRYSGEFEPIDPVAGHIPGAVCIPFADNTEASGKWKSKAELSARFSEVEMSASEPPVFYCGSGVTACHNILAYKIATGKDARLYAGSWSEWINYGNPIQNFKSNASTS